MPFELLFLGAAIGLSIVMLCFLWHLDAILNEVSSKLSDIKITLRYLKK